jgi:hypothetical protein
MKLWKMKKSSDFDHKIMNLVEKKCRHSSNPGQNPVTNGKKKLKKNKSTVNEVN